MSKTVRKYWHALFDNQISISAVCSGTAESRVPNPKYACVGKFECDMLLKVATSFVEEAEKTSGEATNVP